MKKEKTLQEQIEDIEYNFNTFILEYVNMSISLEKGISDKILSYNNQIDDVKKKIDAVKTEIEKLNESICNFEFNCGEECACIDDEKFKNGI